MVGVTFEKNTCPCLNCIFLIQAIRMNEEPSGRYDLKIFCGIARCPQRFKVETAARHEKNKGSKKTT